MRHDKLGLQLDLLLMLTENRQWTIEDLCENLGVQRRNLYYYLEFFKRADFNIQKSGRYYYISRQSPFIAKLCDIVKFTDAEAVTLRRLLNDADGNNLQVRSLRKKLERFYDFHVIEDSVSAKRNAKLAQVLYDAIVQERKVIIHDYSSPHSHSTTDREVEPFLLMNGSNDLRAYECSSKMNKTFRISRMGSVEILDESWENHGKHRQMFTDYFNFSGETPCQVCLRLDQLSYNVLIEEYPRAERDVTADEDGIHWTFTPSVCSMIGIGRFILGLYDHVEVIGSPELQSYISQKLQAFTQIDNKNNTEQQKQ